MGLSMIAIMLFHLWSFYPSIHSSLTNWTMGFGHFGNEVFFFFAGMGCYYSFIKNGTKLYLKNRIRRLFLPCLFAGIIKTFLVMPEKNFLVDIISFNLWFIVAYLVLAFLMPVFSKILFFIRGRLSIFILFLFLYSFLVIFADLMIPGVPNGCLHIAKRGFTSFIVGAWLVSSYFSGKDVLNKISVRGHLIFGLLMISCFFINLEWMFGSSPVNDIHGPHNYFIWIALACPSLVYVASRVLSRAPSFLGDYLVCGLSFIGSITLEIYLFHEFIFNVFRDFNGISRCFPLAAISMIVISLLIAWSFHCLVNVILRKWNELMLGQ